MMIDTSPKGIGKRIRARRVKLGLSQPKLAKIVGSPQQTVGGWETGAARRPSRLLELAKALCTTQEWLLREEGPEQIVEIVPKEQFTQAFEALDPKLRPAALQFLQNLGEKGDKVA